MRMSLEDPRYTQRGERRAALVLGAALIGLPGTGPAALERDVLVASAPEVQFHVIEAGARTRRPALLLIPGWTIPASIRSEQIDVFARERRVVAVDPRSQGKSTKTAEGDTPEQRARDLHSVIQRLELTPLVIVAWSQGVQDVAAYMDQFGTEGIRGAGLSIGRVRQDLPPLFRPDQLRDVAASHLKHTASTLLPSGSNRNPP
jgi:non-heme chloroperoxidase